MAKAALILWI